MFGKSIFNSALLDASAISMGRETMTKLMASRAPEWLSKVPPIHHPHFMTALTAFADMTEEFAKAGEVEKLVELVERFRAYEPMFTKDEFGPFEQKCFAFIRKLQYLKYTEYPAAREKYKSLSQPFMDKAAQLLPLVHEARQLLDQKALNKLIMEWNLVAVQWKKVIDDNFPMTDPELEIHHPKEI